LTPPNKRVATTKFTKRNDNFGEITGRWIFIDPLRYSSYNPRTTDEGNPEISAENTKRYPDDSDALRTGKPVATRQSLRPDGRIALPADHGGGITDIQATTASITGQTVRPCGTARRNTEMVDSGHSGGMAGPARTSCSPS
jgi:hypothetical protein